MRHNRDSVTTKCKSKRRVFLNGKEENGRRCQEERNERRGDGGA